MKDFEVEPGEEIRNELAAHKINASKLISQTIGYLDRPDVDDIALARMLIEEGCSESVAYWIVREAEVRHAPR